MKTETVVLQSWDDLVFENRNKEYGAYHVRRSYSDSVVKAFVLIIAASTTLLILSSMKFSDGENLIKMPTVCPPFILEHITPHIIPDEQAKPLVQKVTKAHRDVAPVITTAQVIDQPTTPIENVSNTGSGKGTTQISTGQVAVTDPATDFPLVDVAPIIHNWVGEMPTYNGGQEAMMKFLQKKLRYPSAAQRMGTEGTVFVSFVVDMYGRVIQAEVVKGIGRECDEEAKRVISMMPLWNPGKQNHNPVMVRMVLPIKFQLSH